MVVSCGRPAHLEERNRRRMMKSCSIKVNFRIYFQLLCFEFKVLPLSGKVSVTLSCRTLLQPHGLLWCTEESTRLLCLWNSPGKNTGVGCHSLLQGIFPTQGSNLGLLHRRRILYCLSHQEDPPSGKNN